MHLTASFPSIASHISVAVLSNKLILIHYYESKSTLYWDFLCLFLMFFFCSVPPSGNPGYISYSYLLRVPWPTMVLQTSLVFDGLESFIKHWRSVW